MTIERWLGKEGVTFVTPETGNYITGTDGKQYPAETPVRTLPFIGRQENRRTLDKGQEIMLIKVLNSRAFVFLCAAVCQVSLCYNEIGREGFIMGVILSPELEKLPSWREMRDYANKRMEEEGFLITVFVRQATLGEEIELLESGNDIFSICREDGNIELVVSLGTGLSKGELGELLSKLGLTTNEEMLMRLINLWVSEGNLPDPEAFVEANIIDMLREG